MSALDFIDCASLGALLRVQTLARQAGGDVVLAAPQRLVLRLLVLTGKGAAFCVHASVAAAVVSVGSRRWRLPLAAACGEHCTPWEGSAVAYWYQVIATGAAAAPAERQQGGSLRCWRGSLRGRMRR
jgi:STAS domain